METVALTVTYNSSLLLKKTLDALLLQTHSVDKIVIVDNASNDENRNRLKEYKEASDKIDILWLENNEGGAGGFYAAMKYAKEQYNPQWFWLMDDDAYPSENCLSVLMSYTEKLSNIGFLAPIIWGIDNKKHQLYHHKKMENGLICKLKPIAESYDKISEIELLDANAFVGLLISAEAVSKSGYPRPELFIEGDDTDYTFRISRQFYGYLIRDAQMNHRDIIINGELNPKGWWKDYYWYRNTMLFQKHNVVGIKRFAGILYVIIWGLKSKHLMHNDDRYQKLMPLRWYVMKKGIIDGLRNIAGKQLSPQDYFAMLDQFSKTGIIKK